MNLQDELEGHGLYLRGVTTLTDDELEQYALPRDKSAIALVGNTGSSYWSGFSQSPEYLDGSPDPLDRWSRRVADDIARHHPVTPLFPFAGPPYYPFQQWARRAEGIDASPLGILIHPRFGLWHSYRFALLGAAFDAAAPVAAPNASPCLACSGRPCLDTCPADAFDGRGYAVDACAGYLEDTPAAACHDGGCLARLACPVAPEMRYLPAQGRFHLRAFLAARQRSPASG